MGPLFKIARYSLLSRKATMALTIFSIALSAVLLMGIERIRTGARQSLESTVSGVDLVVGARSGPVNLLLYSVFRIGDATNNISYITYKKIIEDSRVGWAIPLCLGDSHKGYRVIGTDLNYFNHYKFAGDQPLQFGQGRPFEKINEVVLGSVVAQRLGYHLGDKIFLSHGVAEVTFQDHHDSPFTIVGILQSTGTPVDTSLHISLLAVTAIHEQHPNESRGQVAQHLHTGAAEKQLFSYPDITAFFVKLNKKLSVFDVQRDINNNRDEALLAILPGVALRDLWSLIGVAERALMLVSFMVFVVSILAMVIALVASLNERRREMAILRSIGAPRHFVFALLLMESFILSVIGLIVGFGLLNLLLLIAQPILRAKYGLHIAMLMPLKNDILYFFVVLGMSLMAGAVPAWRAYKNSLNDGLIVKI